MWSSQGNKVCYKELFWFSVRALLGPPGADIEIAVPSGVIVRNDDHRIIGELRFRLAAQC